MKITIEMSWDDEKIVIESSSTEDILKELDNFGKIIKKLSSISLKPPEIKAPPEEKKEVLKFSAVELLKISKARNLSDKLILLFYYLWKSKRMHTINVVDIKNIFKEAMVPPPANPTGLMKFLQKKGFIRPEARKDKFYAWSITVTGAKYVEEELLKSKK